MLHAPELERGDEQKVELAPGVRDAGVVLEPGERGGMQIEDLVPIALDLGAVGLAVEHPERAAGADAGLHRELPAANANR